MIEWIEDLNTNNPFTAGDIFKAAKIFTIKQSGCTEKELDSTVKTSFGKYSKREKEILSTYHSFLKSIRDRE